MVDLVSQHGPAFRALGTRKLASLLARTPFDQEQRASAIAVAAVLPFRVNSYVVDELIDWSAVPNDPIFRLTFPQPDMLPARDLAPLVKLVRQDAAEELRVAARAVRRRLNPHPAGQTDLNVPRLDDISLTGLQHKYPETVLFFPRQGQTCHAYCTYCFRWPQFVGEPELKITGEVSQLVDYLLAHPEVTDVLITGGDPMVMSTDNLTRCVEPLLDPRLAHVVSIRVGTKALSYWPHRFITAPDADALCRLFERVMAAGKQLAFMMHLSHPRELTTSVFERAFRRVRATGAVVRTQAPLIRSVNDNPEEWAVMWRHTVQLGGVPYYMFVERDTGPRNYFEVPLARAWTIFRDAFSTVSGLARTVRGPSMSASPGKVCVDGIVEFGGQRAFVLHYIQARDPSWVGRPFLAKYDPTAAWLSDLVPIVPEHERFFGAAPIGSASVR